MPKKFTRGDRVFVVGGKYKGTLGFYLEETACKYLVLVDGISGERHLDKSNVEHASTTDERNEPRNEVKEVTIAMLKRKCKRLQQEVEEMRAILEKLDIK
jgi:ribosomal protein L24